MRDAATRNEKTADQRRDVASPEIRRIDQRTLFGDARELVISHRGQDYRLRVTSNGKLILTK